MSKKLTVKSAKKVNTPKIDNIAATQKVSVVQKTKSTIATYLFWGLLAAFVAAIFYTLLNFNKPLFQRPAADRIAASVQNNNVAPQPTRGVSVTPAQPIILTPEIDTRVTVVANAVVLTDEQKIEKAQEFILMGVELLKNDQPDLALAEFNSAIALFPTFAPAYVYRGNALVARTDFTGAMDSYINAIKLDQNLAMAWFDKSTLLVQLGDLDGAFDAANAAIESFTAFPDHNQNMFADELFRRRATLNLWKKSWTEAIHDYTMSGSFARNRGEADFADLFGRADAKMGLGDFQGALRDYDSVIKSIATVIGRTENEEEKAQMAQMAMESFEKRAAIRIMLNDVEGAKEDLSGAIVLAGAIGDGERRDALESTLNQL